MVARPSRSTKLLRAWLVALMGWQMLNRPRRAYHLIVVSSHLIYLPNNNQQWLNLCTWWKAARGEFRSLIWPPIAKTITIQLTKTKKSKKAKKAKKQHYKTRVGEKQLQPRQNVIQKPSNTTAHNPHQISAKSYEKLLNCIALVVQSILRGSITILKPSLCHNQNIQANSTVYPLREAG